jgi:protein TonB
MKKLLLALALVVGAVGAWADVPAEEETIFVVVETMPVFPGGQQEMLKFLNEQTSTSPVVTEHQIQGRAICQFVVEKDGSISNVQVMRSSGEPLLDKEAVRILSIMPKWTPGMQRGEPVRIKYTVPVYFRLPE